MLALPLEARIKLHMADWQGALTAAKKLIDGGKYPLVAPTQENFVQMWHGTHIKPRRLYGGDLQLKGGVAR